MAVAAASADEDGAVAAAWAVAVLAEVADGAAVGFAAAFGERLACVLADLGATPLAVLDARIMADAAESTPPPWWAAPLRLTGSERSAESWAACGCPLAATRP